MVGEIKKKNVTFFLNTIDHIYYSMNADFHLRKVFFLALTLFIWMLSVFSTYRKLYC